MEYYPIRKFNKQSAESWKKRKRKNLTPNVIPIMWLWTPFHHCTIAPFHHNKEILQTWQVSISPFHHHEEILQMWQVSIPPFHHHKGIFVSETRARRISSINGFNELTIKSTINDSEEDDKESDPNSDPKVANYTTNWNLHTKYSSTGSSQRSYQAQSVLFTRISQRM